MEVVVTIVYTLFVHRNITYCGVVLYLVDISFVDLKIIVPISVFEYDYRFFWVMLKWRNSCLTWFFTC